MRHIYKSGGDRVKYGKQYTIKAVSRKDLPFYLSNGWVDSFDELPEESGSDYEAELRSKIKALTGKAPGGNSKIATLEKMLEKAESNVQEKG